MITSNHTILTPGLALVVFHFQKNMHSPRRVLEIVEEYRDVKYIDELAFRCIHAERFGSLNVLQAMQLLVKEP